MMGEKGNPNCGHVSRWKEKRELDSGQENAMGTSLKLQASLLLFLYQAVSAVLMEMSGHCREGEWMCIRCGRACGTEWVQLCMGEWVTWAGGSGSQWTPYKDMQVSQQNSAGLPPTSPGHPALVILSELWVLSPFSA